MDHHGVFVGTWSLGHLALGGHVQTHALSICIPLVTAYGSAWEVFFDATERTELTNCIQTSTNLAQQNDIV
jgi:hypothetical protein